jgi:pimeloyl-ACP methyl ester carboxylesterase
VPVLLIHGQIDGNIPVHHSREIHAFNQNTQLWEVPNADHCGAVNAAPHEFDQRLLEWFAPHSPTGN